MGAAVQFRRYRACAVVALLLAGTFVGLDLGLARLFGRANAWHRPNIFWAFVRRVGSQVAAAEQLQRAGRLPPDRLAVVAGVSSVLRGFDGRVLHEHDPCHRHWLVLGGGGGSVTRLEVYLQPLLHSPLQYGHVYLGLHPILFWDGAHPEPLREDIEDLLGGVEPALLKQVQATLLQHSWLGMRWKRAHESWRVTLYQTRLRLLSAMGLGCESTHPAASDPWAPYEMPTADCDTPEGLANQWDRLRPRCRPERYTAADGERAALMRVVHALRKRGAVVTVLRMPEHSRLRRELDPRVVAHFEAAVAAAGGTVPVPLLDLSAAVPDDLFFDHTHLNPLGRSQLSTLFAERFRADRRLADSH